MIYLIDDIVSRQKDYGWSKEKFKIYASKLKVFHNYNEFKNIDIRTEIFQNKNIILFHESFFDSVDNNHKEESLFIRKKLDEFAGLNGNNKLVYFSGSKKARDLNKNIAHLPVDILYKNLEVFITNTDENQSNLKYLLFGNKPELESILIKKLEIWNFLYKAQELEIESNKEWKLKELVKDLNAIQKIGRASCRETV